MCVATATPPMKVNLWFGTTSLLACFISNHLNSNSLIALYISKNKYGYKLFEIPKCGTRNI